jgi:hypothetical protein
MLLIYLLQLIENTVESSCRAVENMMTLNSDLPAGLRGIVSVVREISSHNYEFLLY